MPELSLAAASCASPCPLIQLLDRGRARALDQFYTRPDVAARCLALAQRIIGGSTTLWVEPSAGSGAFLNLLPRPRLGLDIAPADPEVLSGDFLQWSPPPVTDSITVIGNPPFGRNASLAVRFFNHAASFADHIAFILPRSFEKASVQHRLAQNMTLLAEHAMEEDAFLFQGQPRHVPTVFQVWQRVSAQSARLVPARQHADFRFLRRSESTAVADFAFQRVGRRAGRVMRVGLQPRTSHYFIAAADKDQVDTIMRRLATMDWSELRGRTAGVHSIGKAELVAAYSRCLTPSIDCHLV